MLFVGEASPDAAVRDAPVADSSVTPPSDAGAQVRDADAAALADVGPNDVGPNDAEPNDAGPNDAGARPEDAAPSDGGMIMDDAAPNDVGMISADVGSLSDAAPDSGPTPIDGGVGDATCALSVPDDVVLPQALHGTPFFRFYVPHPGWGLAALHASRMLDGLAAQQIDLRLPPSYFLAVALESSFAGCSDSTPADPRDSANRYDRRASTDAEGCFGLNRMIHFDELCKMYDDELDCPSSSAGMDTRYGELISSTNQATTGRDNVESSAILTAWYAVYGYAILQRLNIQPDAWFAAATDPQARTKVMALVHFSTAWHWIIDDAVDCQSQPIESCLAADPINRDHSVTVAGVVATMQAGLTQGQCYDAAVTEADVIAYVDALSVLWPATDWAAVTRSATTALGSGGSFQQVAPAVLDAIDASSGVRLRCPGSELLTFYNPYACPQ